MQPSYLDAFPTCFFFFSFLISLLLFISFLYLSLLFFFFFFNDTATTEIYTLSLHDALPIFSDLDKPYGARDKESKHAHRRRVHEPQIVRATWPGTVSRPGPRRDRRAGGRVDRKSTRLNSSHDQISYAVFCLKKKKKT